MAEGLPQLRMPAQRTQRRARLGEAAGVREAQVLHAEVQPEIEWERELVSGGSSAFQGEDALCEHAGLRWVVQRQPRTVEGEHTSHRGTTRGRKIATGVK